MKTLLLATALALPAVGALAHSDHRAPNGTIVSAKPSGEISVYSPRSSSAQYYWCGVGHYVINKTNAGSGARIYLTEGRTLEGGRYTVSFSLTPPAGAGDSNPLNVSVKVPGDSFSAAAAIQHCYSRTGRP